VTAALVNDLETLDRYWRSRHKPSPRAGEPRAVAESMVSATSFYTVQFSQHDVTSISINCWTWWCV